MESNSNTPTIWFNGWLPNGAKVSFTLPVNLDTAFEEALAFTNAMLAKGFTQSEPGLEDGEKREQIGYVALREKTNNDGTITPVLDIYVNNDRMKFRFLAVYLDTDEDIKAFETVSGLRVVNIPVNPTDSPPDRENKKLVVKLPHPITAIYKENPNYDESSAEKKPKRYFERWDGVTKVLPLDAPAVDGAQSNATVPNFNAPQKDDESLPVAQNAVQTPLNGNGHDKPRRMGEAQWSVFRNDVMQLLIEPAAKFPHEERWNTVNKMREEGAFDGINPIEASKMVLARLANHRKEKTS